MIVKGLLLYSANLIYASFNLFVKKIAWFVIGLNTLNFFLQLYNYIKFDEIALFELCIILFSKLCWIIISFLVIIFGKKYLSILQEKAVHTYSIHKYIYKENGTDTTPKPIRESASLQETPSLENNILSTYFSDITTIHELKIHHDNLLNIYHVDNHEKINEEYIMTLEKLSVSKNLNQ